MCHGHLPASGGKGVFIMPKAKVFITLEVDENGVATITDIKGLTMQDIINLFGKANIGEMSERKKMYLERLGINPEREE